MDPDRFKPWRLGQFMCKAFHRDLAAFSWKQPPYEYEYTKMPIDILNGSDKLRLWVDTDGDLEELLDIEQHGLADFQEIRKSVLQY
jgi:hypothetical protein